MIDSYYRAFYQTKIIEPTLKAFDFASPHFMTLAALIFGVGIIPALAFNYSKVAIVLLLLSGYFDTLDGSLARAQNRVTAKGAVLDIVSDRIVEFSIIFGLALIDPQSRGLMALLMLGSVLICITSFLVIGVFTTNQSEKSFHYSPGIIERTEAFLFFGLMILFPSLFFPLALLFTGLVLLTSTVRIWQFFFQHLKCRSAVIRSSDQAHPCCDKQRPHHLALLTTQSVQDLL